jgi:hypothetical protein
MAAAILDDERRKARGFNNLTDPVASGGTPIPDPMTAPQAAPTQATLPDGTPTYGAQMRKVGGFIADGVQGMAQGVKTAASGLADANVAAFKTAVSAPGYGFNRPSSPVPETATMGAAPGSPQTVGFHAAADSQAANAGAAVVPGSPISAPIGAADSQQANVNMGQGTVAPPNGYTGPAGAALGFDPNVRKAVDAKGKVLYTNQDDASNASLMARGMPSAQNVAAADALSARSAAEGAAATAGVQPAGPQATVIGATGGFGLRDAGYLAGRSNEIAHQQQMAAMTAGLPPKVRAQVMAQLENTAASRDNNAANNSTQRYGYDLNAARDSQRNAIDAQRLGIDRTRLGFDAIRAGNETARTGADVAHSQATTAEVQQRTGAQQQVIAAQAAYQKALATGDQKVIDQAENGLRAVTGKWERTYPDLFSATQVGGGVDPQTGMPRPSSVVVTNKRDGTTKVVNPQDSAAAAPPKFEAGKVYQDAQGRKAKWDGSKFVPA